MTYFIIFMLILMLLCGCVDEVLLVVGICAGIFVVGTVYHFIRWSYDPAYRKRMEKEFEQIRREKDARRKPRDHYFDVPFPERRRRRLERWRNR